MIYSLKEIELTERHAITLSCSNSYLHYHNSKYYSSVVDHFTQLTGGKWVNAVKWFVSNAARAINNNATGFRVSLRSKYYSNNSANIGYKSVKSLLDLLESLGYIDLYKGFVTKWGIDDGKATPEYVIPSCVVFKSPLNDLWDSCTMQSVFMDEEEVYESSVLIRDRNTSNEISTKGHSGVVEARRDMDKYNKSLKGADIKYMGKSVATVEYKRIFLNSMKLAGRLYVDGGGVQILEQRLRSEHLTIDDEPVVELDYHAMHPSILYQNLLSDGLNAFTLLGEDFTPYGADLSFVVKDDEVIEKQSELIGKNYNPLRNLIKLAMLIGINSLDRKQAVGAMSGKIRDDLRADQEDRLFAGVGIPVPVSKILEAVIEHNDLIRDKFYRDFGVLLQKIDSDIMMNVVQTMVQKGHTMLCYHDSVIVKRSAREDLRDAMETAWETELGGKEFCIIEEK